MTREQELLEECKQLKKQLKQLKQEFLELGTEEVKTRRRQLAKERGARLKQLMRARGLTRTKIANDIQRPVASVSALCSGRSLISPTFAFAIEHLYCIASEYLLTGKGVALVTHSARELVNMGTIRDLELEYKRSDTLRILLDNCEGNVRRLKICCEKKGEI